MAIWFTRSCVAERCRERNATHFIYIGTSIYPICGRHINWLKKMGEVILKERTKKKK